MSKTLYPKFYSFFRRPGVWITRGQPAARAGRLTIKNDK